MPVPSLVSPEIVKLLVPRHPDNGCHLSQIELLTLEEDPLERAQLAQQLRWGNAVSCYYHHHHVEATEADYLEWLEELPKRPQAVMRALGFEDNKNALALRRYVLEKNDIGLSDFLKVVLSPADWQAYQETSPAELNPWLPPLT